ncbi:MGMT family protein [Streptomyces sp. KK5PA1]|uniref:MGMT family protein n=2 Tax=Actinacidiphila acididurans TaxID=2784346 RepID=A0ABS2U6F3_9ACTN|nr:MGMT family protein [Actinacidiphila acididurans]
MTPAPLGFAAGVLRAAGVAPERYDTYTEVATAAGVLYVAHRGGAVTGAALASAAGGATGFEEAHRGRAGRSAIPAAAVPAGLRTAVRTGRFAKLPLDLGPVQARMAAVLTAVRAVPRGQLRPASWVAREAGLTGPGAVLEVLAANPVQVLVPSYRVTDEDGLPYDLGHGAAAGDALRRAEAVDVERVVELARQRTVFLGSDTTHIYCHPTCAHARRITPRHQVPFRSAGQARLAGYRPCKSCRPAA